MSNGDIRFIGRLDFQVKIRGFRVEPGEVEVALQELGCTTAVVAAEAGELVAYVTPAQNVTDLRKRLAERLPPYFVPLRMLAIDELPRTENGKFNREVLRKMLLESSADEEEEFIAPRSELERKVADLVQEVLDNAVSVVAS
jgi:acyl-coenzyme A synthetase/AMP-(fatty) acid ligase